MQKTQIMQAIKADPNAYFFVSDNKSLYTLSEEPAVDSGYTSQQVRAGWIAQLLDPEQHEASSDWEVFNIPTLIGNESYKERVEAQLSANQSYRPTRHKVWLVKLLNYRDVIAPEDKPTVKYGYISSVYFHDVMTPDLFRVFEAKRQYEVARKARDMAEAQVRRDLEKQSEDARWMAREQVKEQLEELLGRSTRSDEVTIHTQGEVEIQVDTNKPAEEISGKVKTTGEVRIDYATWNELVRKLEKLYDQIEA